MKSIARESSDNRKDAGEAVTSADPARRSSGVQARAPRADPQSAAELGTADPALVSLSCSATSGLLEATYAYICAYTSACLPPSMADRLNVAVYELLDNAMKHGIAAGDVRLELRRTYRGVELVIENEAEAAQLTKLGRHLEQVLRDPRAAFMKEMTRFASNSGPAPMLGLVRAAHQSELELEHQLEGSRVRLTAICPY